MNENQILDQKKVDQIVKRIAYQIHENYLEQEKLFLIGVDIGGRVLADQFKEYLKDISSIEVDCSTIILDKESPLSRQITIDGDLDEITKHPIVLCDDVLNTGKTLTYCLSKLLMWDLKRIETAVLILRSYSQFPIYATYKGYQLATTINEHVKVVPGEGVYLN